MKRLSRSSWFAPLLLLWYALVTTPALPAVWHWGGGSASPSHNAVCSCASCSGEDSCCCVPPATEEEPGGPAWRPMDCAVVAGWLLAKQAPAVLADVEPAVLLARSGAEGAVPMPRMVRRAVGVPEPPPRAA